MGSRKMGLQNGRMGSLDTVRLKRQKEGPSD